MRSAPKLVGATSIYGYLSWIAWKSLPSMDSHVSQVRTSMSLRCYDAGQKRYERKEHQTQNLLGCENRNQVRISVKS
jgi:hypothetical protein